MKKLILMLCNPYFFRMLRMGMVQKKRILNRIKLFPVKKEQTKKWRVSRQHLPSVLMSQKWRDLFNA